MAGFMAGFGTTMAKLIENDREYFRDRAAKRQEYLQTYGTRAVTDRQDKAAQSMSVVNSLITAGVPQEDVRYVLDKSGIQGLAQLKATIDSRSDLTAEERTTLVKKASDYVADNKGEDFETVINRAWGLYKSSDNPVQRERNIFSAMLGLDANMMEEDVLDDLYVNGYSGRDIYRIMGTSGPKPGEALDLNLPTKPASDQKMAFAMKSLNNQFETGIDSALAILKNEQAQLAKTDTDALTANYKRQDELETLKGQGVNGWATWAQQNPSFYEYAKSLEDTQPGVITRNLAMRPFIPAYRDFFEEAQDEAKMAAGAGTTATAAPSFTVSPPAGDGITLQTGNAVMEFETIAEFNTAAAAGNIPAGASVSVNEPIKDKEGKVRAPGTVFKLETKKEEPKTTDLGDMTGAPGFREERETPEAITEINIPKRSSWTPTSQPADENGRLLTTDDILFDTLVYDRQNEPFPDSFYIDAGYTQEQLDRVKKEVDAAFKTTQATSEAAPDIDAALDRLPDHLEKLGTQGMDAWRKFTKAVSEYSYTMPSRPLSQRQLTDTPSNTLGFMIVGAMVDTLGDAAETTEDLEVFTNVFTRASDTPAYKQLEELIQERKNLPAKKAKKVVEEVQELEVDQAMLGYVQKMDEMGRTPSREEVEKLKTVLEQEQLIDTSTDELYRGPISGKTLVEKLDDIYNFYTTGESSEYNPRAIGTVGSRDLGLRDTTDDVRPPRGEAPERAASLARPASPEADRQEFDSPRNMAVENMTTRGRFQTPSGLMSRPSPESPPQLGSAEFTQMIKRVHGSSKAAKAFGDKVSSGKLTAADVTRMIKATDKLPNTKTKDQLLLSLYDLRDSLNKR